MMALIKEHGVTTTVFCKHYGIKSVAQLPLSLRDDAIQACRNYKTKKAAATADKKAAQ